MEDDSSPLMERLLRGISEANAREFEAVQSSNRLTEEEKNVLFEEMSKLLMPEKHAQKTEEEFLWKSLL